MDVATPPRPELDAPEASPNSAPTWVRRLALGLAAALIVAVGGLAVVGGFDQRDDHIQVAAGAEIDAGNLVFTLDRATAKRLYSGQWLVLVDGTVRNPNTDPLSPLTGDRGNLAVRPAAHTEAAMVLGYVLGGSPQRSYVPPDNQPMPFEAEFRLDAQWQLSDSIDCAVFTMEYTDPTVLGLGSGSYWNLDSYSRVHFASLPLTVLTANP